MTGHVGPTRGSNRPACDERRRESGCAISHRNVGGVCDVDPSYLANMGAAEPVPFPGGDDRPLGVHMCPERQLVPLVRAYRLYLSRRLAVKWTASIIIVSEYWPT